MLGINDYIQITRRALARLGEQVTARLKWGYGYCESKQDHELHEYAKAVELIRNRPECLCDEEIESIKSNIHRILGPECNVVENDFTREKRADLTKYLLQNPDCQAYDYMVDYFQSLCKKINLDLKVVQSACEKVNIAFKVTDKPVCEAIDILLDIQDQNCDIDLNVDVSIQQCLIDFQTQVIPRGCDIDFRTYVEEINCGASIDMVLQSHDCSVDLDIDVDNGCTEEEETEASQVLGDFAVSADDTTVCYYTDVVLSIDNLQHPVEYSWDFGSGASPATAEGFGPHTVQYTTAGSKTVTVTATLGEETSEETLGITVSSCPGQMVGTVEDTVGNPLASYNFRLYADADQDGVADGAFVRNIFSNGSGGWSMASLTPGHYTLEANFADDDVTFEDIGDQDGVVDTLDSATPVVAGNKAVKVIIRPSQTQGTIQVVVDLT